MFSVDSRDTLVEAGVMGDYRSRRIYRTVIADNNFQHGVGLLKCTFNSVCKETPVIVVPD